MKTTFYVYKVENSYVKITGLKAILIKDINKASYWNSKKNANSWSLESKYPKGKLVECGLCEK